MKPSLKTKLIAVLFGTVLALLLLELGLRTSGAILFLSQKQNAAQGIDFNDEKQYRILCLGESTTAEWFSRDRSHSWPLQLERMLNENAREGRTFKVINEGISGTMTAFILARLEENIDLYRPHMVVTMMGINDNQAPIYFRKTGATSVQMFLLDLRVTKFFRLLVGAVTEQFSRLRGDRGADYVRQLNSVIKDTSRLKLLKTTLTEKRELYTARRIYKELLDDYPELKEPLDRYYTMTLAWIVHRRLGFDQKHFHYLEKKLSEFIKAPYPSTEEIGTAYVGLSSLYRATNRDAKYVATIKKGLPFISFDGDKHIAMMHLSMIQQRAKTPFPEIDAIFEAHEVEFRPTSKYGATRQHYRAIYDIVRARGIDFVAMQYPTLDIRLLKYFLSGKTDAAIESSPDGFFLDQPSDAYDDVLKDDPRVLFVSNQKPFEEALKKEPFDALFIDRFGGSFGHATQKGNRLIAQQLAASLSASHLF